MTEPNSQFATAREHWGLVERVAIVEADMRQIGPALARIETALAAKGGQHAPQETAAALALHRAVDAFDKVRGNGGGPALTALAIIGACALTAVGMWLVLGGGH